MRGTEPLSVLAVFLLELGCILHGLARPSVVEGEPPPLPQPASRAAAPERTPVRTEAMLARPLFTPGRIPFREGHAPAPAPAAPRLTGLIVAEQRGRAIFAGPDGKPVVLGEGGRLGPFTVLAVRPDGVDLSGPPGLRTLRPSSDAALRPQAVYKPAVLALIDPDQRELETENDQ
jgi:hypothetical protein